MFFVYIIYSKPLDKYYTGYTEDLKIRLKQHNTGISKFNSKANDWELKYFQGFETRVLAHQFELKIKKKKSRKYLEFLIHSVFD